MDRQILSGSPSRTSGALAGRWDANGSNRHSGAGDSSVHGKNDVQLHMTASGAFHLVKRGPAGDVSQHKPTTAPTWADSMALFPVHVHTRTGSFTVVALFVLGILVIGSFAEDDLRCLEASPSGACVAGTALFAAACISLLASLLAAVAPPSRERALRLAPSAASLSWALLLVALLAWRSDVWGSTPPAAVSAGPDGAASGSAQAEASSRTAGEAVARHVSRACALAVASSITVVGVSGAATPEWRPLLSAAVANAGTIIADVATDWHLDASSSPAGPHVAAALTALAVYAALAFLLLPTLRPAWFRPQSPSQGPPRDRQGSAQGQGQGRSLHASNVAFGGAGYPTSPLARPSQGDALAQLGDEGPGTCGALWGAIKGAAGAAGRAAASLTALQLKYLSALVTACAAAALCCAAFLGTDVPPGVALGGVVVIVALLRRTNELQNRVASAAASDALTAEVAEAVLSRAFREQSQKMEKRGSAFSMNERQDTRGNPSVRQAVLSTGYSSAFQPGASVGRGRKPRVKPASGLGDVFPELGPGTQQELWQLAAEVTPETPLPYLNEHPDVTCIFTDLVGFTSWVQDLKPAVAMQVLQTYFSRLDALMDLTGCFKYQTVGDAYVVLCGYSGVDPDHPTTALRVARAMVHVASSILIPEDDGANAGPRQWHSEGGTAREARRKAAAQAKASRMSGSGALGTGALEGSGRRGVAGEEGGPSLGSHGSGGGLMVGGSGRDGANAGMMLECLPEEVEGEMAGDSGRKEEGEGERENEKGWEGKGWGGKGVSLERGGVSGEVLLRQTVGDAGSGFQRSALKAWTRTTGTGETVDAHGARGGDKAVRRTGTGLNQGAMGASGREASGGVGRGTGTEEEGGSVGAGALYVGRPLEIRVGVHTGPIAASTLGFRRNTLTLVGDTLNVASRMETSSKPGHVRMTQATYARLPAIVQRHFVPQKIYIKGKGDMQTYSADVHSLPAF